MTDSRTELEALAARVRALEASRGRSRILASLGALALCCLPLIAFTGPRVETVQAQRFELLDDNGKVRGVWGFTKTKKEPTFELFDKNDVERMRLRIDGRDGPIVAILDADKMLRAALATDMTGLPHFTMSDAGQKVRLHMNVSASDSPAMMMIHKDGTMPAGIGVDRHGKGWFKPTLKRPKTAPATEHDGHDGHEHDADKGKEKGNGK